MQNPASEIQRITTYGDKRVLEMQSLAAAVGITSSQMSETIRSAIILRARNGRDDGDKSGGGAKKIKKIIDAGKNCYSVD